MSGFARWLVVGGLCAGCGGTALPPSKMADTQSSISAAAAVGAEQDPQAALHLKMARDQLAQAQKLASDGHGDQAQLVLQRADADAELAMMLTREAQAHDATDKAQTDLKSLDAGQPSSQSPATEGEAQ